MQRGNVEHDDELVARECGKAQRVKFASGPGSSGSSVDEWEIIPKDSDAHAEAQADRCAEIER